MRNAKTWALCAALIASFLAPSLAAYADPPDHYAQRHDRGHEMRRAPPGRAFRDHDIRRFRDHDMSVWRGGRWFHGRHDNRLGWWWIVGGVWFFYPAPVYPYPNPYVPPGIGVYGPGVTVRFWYYCYNPAGYYPYVPYCYGPWHRVRPR